MALRTAGNGTDSQRQIQETMDTEPAAFRGTAHTALHLNRGIEQSRLIQRASPFCGILVTEGRSQQVLSADPWEPRHPKRPDI